MGLALLVAHCTKAVLINATIARESPSIHPILQHVRNRDSVLLWFFDSLRWP